MTKRDHPVMILIRGLPGSGKSHLAKALAKALGDDDVVLLDPDATDYDSAEYKEHVKTATAEGVNPSLHAYRFLRAKAYRGIADHKIVIWNQPFSNLEIFRKMVARLKKQADEHQTSLPMLVVEVDIDWDTAVQRVSERKGAGGHGPSDDTFERFLKDYKTFEGLEFTVIRVKGDDDVSRSVSVIMAKLRNLN